MNKQQKPNPSPLNPSQPHPSPHPKEPPISSTSTLNPTRYQTPKKQPPTQDNCLKKHDSNSSPYHLHSRLLQFCELAPIVRQRMTVWLRDEAARRFLLRDTAGLAAYLMDLFMVRDGVVGVGDVQELAIACLNLAVKFNQASTRPIQYNTQLFSKQSVNNFQLQILKKSQFKLNPPNYSRIASNLLQKLSNPSNPNLNLNPSNPPTSPHIPQSSTFALTPDNILQFYQLLDCSMSVKEMLDYDVEDVVYNGFLVFFTHFTITGTTEGRSGGSGCWMGDRDGEKENLGYWMECMLDQLYREDVGSCGQEYRSICFDSPIQQLLSIVLTSLQKHRQQIPLTSPLCHLQLKLPKMSIAQLLQIQTTQPYHLKVIKQCSPKISHLQSTFQI